MAYKLATSLGVFVWLVGVVAGMGLFLDNEEMDFENFTDTEESVSGLSINASNLMRGEAVIGNIVYSVIGFFLGGSLLFVTLFDPTRKPVINFFNNLFGNRPSRRRREAGTGLESHVAIAFDTFVNAVDKMEMIARVAKQ